MRNWYRCDICGCYLDPGEGGRCDECREKEERKARERRELRQLWALLDSGSSTALMEKERMI